MLAHERSWRPPYRVPPPHPRERRARWRKRRHQSEYAWPPPCRRDFRFCCVYVIRAAIGQRRARRATAWSGVDDAFVINRAYAPAVGAREETHLIRAPLSAEPVLGTFSCSTVGDLPGS